MKYLPIIWRNLLRRKIRTIFTLLTVFIAFVLFGVLMAIRAAFSMGVEIAGADRLMILNKISLIMPIPASYAERVRAVPGVKDVTHANWFGGYYQDPKTGSFANMAVDPESWLRMYPEFERPEDQKKAWFANRTGAIVGSDTAKKFGWKVGDHVPLISPIYRKPDGSPWDFTIEGIYTSTKKGVDKTQFFFHYDYLEENRSQGAGTVGWYVIKIDDGSRAVEMGHTFDAMFENSSAETKTTTEKGFVDGFAKQVGDIGAIMIAVSSVVLFMFGLVAASTMAQSVRERTSELAVLKTLGFSGPAILVLVLAESLFIVCLAGGLGLFIAWLIVRNGDPTGGMLAIFILPARDVWIGVGLMTAMGMVAGAAPAIGAMRLKITDALRRS